METTHLPPWGPYAKELEVTSFATDAERALALWEREVGESWCCFEHFPIETQRGAGWHHFGGLSSPILS